MQLNRIRQFIKKKNGNNNFLCGHQMTPYLGQFICNERRAAASPGKWFNGSWYVTITQIIKPATDISRKNMKHQAIYCSSKWWNFLRLNRPKRFHREQEWTGVGGLGCSTCRFWYATRKLCIFLLQTLVHGNLYRNMLKKAI